MKDFTLFEIVPSIPEELIRLQTLNGKLKSENSVWKTVSVILITGAVTYGLFRLRTLMASKVQIKAQLIEPKNEKAEEENKS